MLISVQGEHEHRYRGAGGDPRRGGGQPLPKQPGLQGILFEPFIT